MKFGVSKKIMRPYVTLLNIFSEIALIFYRLSVCVTVSVAKIVGPRNVNISKVWKYTEIPFGRSLIHESTG